MFSLSSFHVNPMWQFSSSHSRKSHLSCQIFLLHAVLLKFLFTLVDTLGTSEPVEHTKRVILCSWYCSSSWLSCKPPVSGAYSFSWTQYSGSISFLYCTSNCCRKSNSSPSHHSPTWLRSWPPELRLYTSKFISSILALHIIFSTKWMPMSFSDVTSTLNSSNSKIL